MNDLAEGHQTLARPELADAGRTVIKLGTRVLTHDDGRLSLGRLYSVIETVAELRRDGREVLVVSSGAVGLGCQALQLEETPERLALRQAAAAVGQGRLMAVWEEGFSRAGLLSAQVLLTQGDFDDRQRYLNLRRALVTLLRHGVVPVINENDVVSTEELEVSRGAGRPVFGDNDRLSALVATKLHADLLVLLTDVPGVFDRHPSEPGAILLGRVDDPEEVADAGPSLSGVGRGGMRSKVEAALVAARGGCHSLIVSGRETGALGRALAGREEGTWFPARGRLAARRQWIAFAAASRGTLVLDDGAVEALRNLHASLLAAGVTAVEGNFHSGDVIDLVDRHRNRVGRGLVRWDAPTVRAWCAGRPPRGDRSGRPLIRRNYLVLEV